MEVTYNRLFYKLLKHFDIQDICMMKIKISVILILTLLFSTLIVAQPSVEYIKVIVTPDHEDWTYEVGESATFSITVLKNNTPLEGVEIKYDIRPEMVDSWQGGTLFLKGASVNVKSKKVDTPCFIRCKASVVVNGKKYSSYAKAGFSPSKIEPTTTLPSDFETFWDKGKESLSKIPMNPVMTLMPERCTDKVNVYHVSLDNIQGKFFGVLCVPKKEGKYPAILHVPGAGSRPYYGQVTEAAEGFVTFEIGIHGIPVNLDKTVYNSLIKGPLYHYSRMNLDDKDNAYYRRVYLGCVRAVDFIESVESFDGENIGVTGGSQGGALSIVTASLDSRIDYLAAFYPALCDLTGFLYGRAGGWPKLFRDQNTNKPDKIETSKYFDVVNFARFVKVPGFYSWGYNDDVCAPTSLYSAYNVLEAPKELHIFQEARHWKFPEQIAMRNDWLYKRLKK